MQRRIRHHRIHLYPYAFTNFSGGQIQFVTPNPTPIARYLRKDAPQLRSRPHRIHLTSPPTPPSLNSQQSNELPLASWRQ